MLPRPTKLNLAKALKFFKEHSGYTTSDIRSKMILLRCVSAAGTEIDYSLNIYKDKKMIIINTNFVGKREKRKHLLSDLTKSTKCIT